MNVVTSYFWRKFHLALHLRFPTKALPSPTYHWLWVILLFVPLLFISNRSSHDWGDDFAQYIHQAKNIVQGIPQSETGFIYSQENFIGPRAYPVGFPLLLSPVYAIFGNNMKVFTGYISVFYFMLALLLVLFYRKYFSLLPALVLTVILLYNPQMLVFKQEVMSDLPFALLLVTGVLLYRHSGQSLPLLIALILATGLMITVRPVGFVFVAAVVTDQLILMFRNTETKLSKSRQLLRIMIFALAASGIFVLLNVIIFKIPSSGGLVNYIAYFRSGEMAGTIMSNLSHYPEVFRYIYTPAQGISGGFSLLAGVLFLAMVLVGLLKRITSGIEFIDIFFLFYLAVLLVFPNNASAFRLMVPVGFLLLLYVAEGFKSLALLSSIAGKWKALALGVLMLLLYLPGINDIIRSKYSILEGPQKPESEEAFSYIRDSIPPDAIIMFRKPRALSLYAERTSFADPVEKDMTKFHEQAMTAGVNYFLINSKISSEESKRYMRVMGGRAKKIWSNEAFDLYSLQRLNP